jgi:hypothetical protein
MHSIDTIAVCISSWLRRTLNIDTGTRRVTARRLCSIPLAAASTPSDRAGPDALLDGKSLLDDSSELASKHRHIHPPSNIRLTNRLI